MKIKLKGYEPLKASLEAEGDSLVTKDENLLLDECLEGPMPQVAASTIGLTYHKGEEFFMVTKKFFTKWSNQTYISFSLPTLMNDNLGYIVESGRVGRYVDTKDFDGVFELLSPLLNEMNYSGFISIKFNSDKELINVFFGAGLALYNILEGVRGKISDFFFTEESVLESWTVSLIVSRYPYPFREDSERIFLDIIPSARKHLWFYGLCNFRKSSYTNLTRVCIATAWATTLNEVARRVYRTCDGLNIPLKQFRTDITPYISNLWAKFTLLNQKSNPSLQQ